MKRNQTVSSQDMHMYIIVMYMYSEPPNNETFETLQLFHYILYNFSLNIAHYLSKKTILGRFSLEMLH